MTSISTWYHNQYSTWNRTRRLQTTPYLARTDTLTSRTATSMARTNTRDAVIINMAYVGDTAPKKDKKQETLFGPTIGVVSSTPQWTNSTGHKVPADNISSHIIQNWIARSKEPSQPTTTLQALVNLKRPTLHLSPLTISPGDDPDHLDSLHHHGLEFEYDCDAPKCRINVNVVLPADHPCAETVDSTGYSCISVFESVVDGGFGKALKLEEGATLELGRFERTHTAEHVSTRAPESSQTGGIVDSTPAASGRNDRPRKRFTGFNFRKRSVDRSVSGPALTVVDAEASPHTDETSVEKEDKEDTKDGVRVTIQLSALDEDGTDMSLANEQVTYLHVVRFGPAPPDGAEDSRPWVVKVVKREATIGPHTFHLHEIYGLSSQSSSSSHPQSTSPSPDVHTYPPASAPAAPVHEDEPSSECLLCLSSPREVILLPCRHLVACKECAINMVEFGAGGNIVHTEDTPTTGGEGGDAATPEGSAPVPTVAPQNVRRKRKAKGWFCPVCRQPYTSLLRISTMPPTKDISDDENRPSMDEHEHDDDEHENEHENEHEHSNDPLSAAPAAAGGMLSSIRSSLMRLNPRSENGHTAETTEAEHPTEVPTTVV